MDLQGLLQRDGVGTSPYQTCTKMPKLQKLICPSYRHKKTKFHDLIINGLQGAGFQLLVNPVFVLGSRRGGGTVLTPYKTPLLSPVTNFARHPDDLTSMFGSFTSPVALFAKTSYFCATLYCQKSNTRKNRKIL